MKFRFQPFHNPDDFEVLPTLTLSPIRCGDPDCQALHGYSIRVQWTTFGVGLHFFRSQ